MAKTQAKTEAAARAEQVRAEQAMVPMQFGADAWARWFEATQEVTRFCARRLSKDMEVMNAFAACRTPQQFNSVWMRATRETLNDYAEEMNRVLTLSARDANQK